MRGLVRCRQHCGVMMIKVCSTGTASVRARPYTEWLKTRREGLAQGTLGQPYARQESPAESSYLYAEARIVFCCLGDEFGSPLWSSAAGLLAIAEVVPVQKDKCLVYNHNRAIKQYASSMKSIPRSQRPYPPRMDDLRLLGGA
jgi:hypothetical protein